MKTFPTLPHLGGNRPDPAASANAVFAPRPAPAPPPKPVVEAPVATPRRQYRRSPFYLKIEGLTGPRPKFDEFGRPVPDEA